ncbi:hypothetical protein VNI00_014079 [Paramarasmius palmivorus]|uniref:GmrSD restriction endonucleases N-terminal domain-containing protein n=1 Tax=Paramarasmius palmivorus TaxID=297713 RepID=A0AAW0BTA1_9AGAR
MKQEDTLQDRLLRAESPEAEDTGSQATVDVRYDVRDSLKEPNGERKTIKEIHAMLSSGMIDLHADYQRNDVWNDDRQVSLIDSVLRNYYIPPVIFATSKDEDSNVSWKCMDGKQRITSIKRYPCLLFMTVLFAHAMKVSRGADSTSRPCFKSITRQELYFRDNKTIRKRKKHLPQHVKDLFLSKCLYCVAYAHLDFVEEQNIFKRVQLGVPLRFAENLYANFTPRANFARELSKKLFPQEKGIADKCDIPINTGRGKGFQILVQAMCALSRWELGEECDVQVVKGLFSTAPQEAWVTEKVTVPVSASKKERGPVATQSLFTDDEDEDEDEEILVPVSISQEFRERIHAAIDSIIEMAQDPLCIAAFSKYQWSQTISPVAAIGWIVLAYHGDQGFSRLELTNMFLLMRAHLHRTHQAELKLKPSSGETLLRFIIEAMKDPSVTIRKARTDGLLEWAEGIALNGAGNLVRSSQKLDIAQDKQKRKRQGEDEASGIKQEMKKMRTTSSRPSKKSSSKRGVEISDTLEDLRHTESSSLRSKKRKGRKN